MSGPRVRHPIAARAYERVSQVLERRAVGEHRDELLEGLAGRVIEVGAGNGLNFAHYPPAVEEVLAVEPEPYLRRLAERAAAEVTADVRVVDAVAEELPAADASFDAGVVSLVLCSVADPRRALAELRRVVRPGGELRFYEHVVAEDRRVARLQSAVDVVWPRVAGGCHASRDTLREIRDAGFVFERMRRFGFRPCLLGWFVEPHVIGVARRP